RNEICEICGRLRNFSAPKQFIYIEGQWRAANLHNEFASIKRERRRSGDLSKPRSRTARALRICTKNISKSFMRMWRGESAIARQPKTSPAKSFGRRWQVCRDSNGRARRLARGFCGLRR